MFRDSGWSFGVVGVDGDGRKWLDVEMFRRYSL